MKTVKTHFFLLALIPLLFTSSCFKEDIDDLPFYCEIDGEPIHADGGSGGIFGLDPIQAQYYQSENRFGFLIFHGESNSLNLVGDTRTEKVEAFKYLDFSKENGCIRFELIDDYALKINFIKFDSIKSKIKLTFEGNLKNQCGETVQVRKGRFNHTVLWYK